MSKKYAFTLVGSSALLMHKDDVLESDRLKIWQRDPANKDVSVAGDDRSPPWTWQCYLYHDGIHVAMPSDNLAACIRTAAAKIKIGKGAKTYKEISQSGIFFTENFQKFTIDDRQLSIKTIISAEPLPFTDHLDMARRMGFKLFVKRARVNKAKSVRVRPMFDGWKVEGTFLVQEFAERELTEEVLKKIWGLAGFVGLGDWRPGGLTPGRFGMFKLEELRRI